MSDTTCVFCAEPLQEGAARCPACGEATTKQLVDLGPPRPIGPKLVAWFNLLFGGLGLFGPIVTVVMYTVLPPDPNDALRAAAEAYPLFKGWIFLSQGLGFLLAGGMLASGVGLLSWREWSRRLAVQVAGGQLALLLLSSGISAAVLAAALSKSAAAGGLPAVTQGAALGAILFGSCFGAILPVATLLVLRRPSTREVFAAHEAERPAK